MIAPPKSGDNQPLRQHVNDGLNSYQLHNHIQIPKTTMPAEKESTPPHISIQNDDDESHGSPKANTPRSSTGWDGKLRIEKEKKAELVNPEAISDPEYSDEEQVLPGETIEADEGILLYILISCSRCTALSLRGHRQPANHSQPRSPRRLRTQHRRNRLRPCTRLVDPLTPSRSLQSGNTLVLAPKHHHGNRRPVRSGSHSTRFGPL